MRIGGCEVEKERARVISGNELAGVFDHLDRVARIATQIGIVVIHMLGADVIFTDMPGSITRCVQDVGKA